MRARRQAPVVPWRNANIMDFGIYPRDVSLNLSFYARLTREIDLVFDSPLSSLFSGIVEEFPRNVRVTNVRKHTEFAEEKRNFWECDLEEERKRTREKSREMINR